MPLKRLHSERHARQANTQMSDNLISTICAFMIIFLKRKTPREPSGTVMWCVYIYLADEERSAPWGDCLRIWRSRPHGPATRKTQHAVLLARQQRETRTSFICISNIIRWSSVRMLAVRTIIISGWDHLDHHLDILFAMVAVVVGVASCGHGRLNLIIQYCSQKANVGLAVPNKHNLLATTKIYLPDTEPAQIWHTASWVYNMVWSALRGDVESWVAFTIVCIFLKCASAQWIPI